MLFPFSLFWERMLVPLENYFNVDVGSLWSVNCFPRSSVFSNELCVYCFVRPYNLLIVSKSALVIIYISHSKRKKKRKNYNVRKRRTSVGTFDEKWFWWNKGSFSEKCKKTWCDVLSRLFYQRIFRAAIYLNICYLCHLSSIR